MDGLNNQVRCCYMVGYFYNISITKEQITSIERILSQSYNYIELQHIENSIPVTRLSEIEDIQLRKHFS